MSDPYLYKEYAIKSCNKKFGIVNADTNEVIIDYVFDEIKWLKFSSEAVACFRLGNKWGFIPHVKLYLLKYSF